MKRTGELLKKAREEKGLSLHEVALFLKINSRVLLAIEEDDQSQLPARTFLRGFIQSYAKFLKLDAQAVLQLFAEETGAAAATTPKPSPTANAAPAGSLEVVETAPSVESKPKEETKPAEAKTEVDVISLEKSILAKNQVSQDKLGFRTIAISIVGLVIVLILYSANNVIKKYQREAQVDPNQSVTETAPQTADSDNDDADQNAAPVAADTAKTSDTVDTAKAVEPAPATKPAEVAKTAPATPATSAAATVPATPAKPTTVSATPTLSPAPSLQSLTPPNSVQPHSNMASSPIVAPISLPAPSFFDTKPKGAEKTEQKPFETAKPADKTALKTEAAKTLEKEPVKPADAAKPADKIAAAPKPTEPAKPTDKPADKIPEGKLVEVIVEATDAVEIEYSSAKTSPQKMVLKADQIHTFKSRSGVRLKISNGGAVNIIMNGRDLGAPGAAGQPIQVAY